MFHTLYIVFNHVNIVSEDHPVDGDETKIW